MKQIILIIIACILNLNAFSQLKWVQVWGDEFDYTGAPDETKWGYDIGGDGFGNQEAQYYTDKIENSFVENGLLTIRSKKEAYMGNEYTSAKLITKNLADWTYGKIEVKAKLPSGTGVWPAIWMLPTSNTYGGWPKSGEIDIMEYVGFEKDKIHWNIHTESYNHTLGTNKGKSENIEDVETSFHVYGLEWYEDSLLFMVDNVVYFTYAKESDDYKVWPYKHPFYLILNTAVGGTWGGLQGIDDNALPSDFVVDYVHVYEQASISNTYNITLNQNDGGNASASNNGSVNASSSVTFTASPNSGYEFSRWSGTFDSPENPLIKTVELDITLTPIYKKQGEMLSNSNLNEDLSSWWYNNGGASTFEITNNQLEIDIPSSQTNDWDIQLSQDGLTLLSGHTYEFSFDASSIGNTSFKAGVGLNYTPWTAFLNKTISTTSTKKTYTYTFTMNSTDDDSRVFFDLGKASGVISIDNVSLVDLTILGEDKEISSTPSVYPNPSNSFLKIDFTKKVERVKVISSTGRTSVFKVINGVIDTETLDSGIFKLQVVSEGETFNTTFVKE